MLNASGMQLIFLPKPQKIIRRVWMLLNVIACVRGGGGEGWLSPSKLETTQCRAERCETVGDDFSTQTGDRKM